MTRSNLTRKIVAPDLPPMILHRQYLIDALIKTINSNTHVGSVWYKLLLLCSPAGYGKTTLLTDFANHVQVPCCWLTFDSLDNSTTTFIELLFASVHHQFPCFEAAFDEAMSQIYSSSVDHPLDLYSFQHLIEVFVTAIEREIEQQFVLIFCNYHKVNDNPDINTLVNKLVSSLPRNCLLIIESRAVPKLEFAPLLVRRQIVGIGTDELRFTPQDIQDLTVLFHHSPCSMAEAEQLCAMFDGWISGILLGTRLGNQKLSLPSQQTGRTVHATILQEDRHYLFAYFVSEVFAKEQEVYNFLKDVSVLQQMTPELCNALLEISDAQTRLNYIEQQGLFVTRNGQGDEQSYTCHPVLSEFLANELHTQQPQRYLEMQRRASLLFVERNEYAQAISHAFLAHDYTLAAQLIKHIAHSILRKGYSESLACWIDMLPAELLENDALLLLTRANLYLIRFQTEDATPLLAQASTVCQVERQRADTMSISTLEAEVLISQSIIFFRRGEYVQTQEVCQQALNLLPADRQELHAQIYQRLGACACLLGNVTSGIAQLQQALQLWGHKTKTRQTALLHTYLANAYNISSNYTLSEHYRKKALQYFDQVHDDWGKIHSLIGMSTTKRCKGAFVEAEATVQQARALALQIHFQSGEAYALITLGEIYQDQSLYEDSLRVAEEALTLALSLHDRYLINCVLCILALNYLFIGDMHTALQYADEIDIREKEATSYEVILRNVTRSIILFWQKRYEEMEQCLSYLYQSLHTTNLTPLLLRAHLYRAACYLAQGKVALMRQALEDATPFMQQESLQHLVTIELGRLPNLQHAMQNMTDISDADQESIPSETPASLINHETLSVAVKNYKMRILTFGEPTVLIEEMPITHWRMVRSMELFFFLLDAGSARHKEQLMTALWPESDEHSEQNLRAVIYYLRKVLGQSVVIYNAGTYTLNLAPTYGESIWYDADLFCQYAEEAKADVAAHEKEVLLRKMVRLYRGDFMQTCYSDWCSRRREELKQLYFQALRDLAVLYWKQARFDESISYWQKILVMDNCNEEAYHGLIRCYAKQGKRSLALRQYQDCVDVLHTELTITPSPSLQKLYHYLKRND